MTRPMILLGAIVLWSTLAGPAAAQHVSSSPGRCTQFYPNANCQNYGPGNSHISYGWRRAYNSYGDGGHRRHDGADRPYRQPVGQANLSMSYW